MPETLVIRVEYVPSEITPLDALTRWARSLPHLGLSGIGSLAGIANAFLIGGIVVVTGRRPRRLMAFQAWAVRERVRAFSYFFLLQPDRPAVPGIALVDDLTDPHTEVSTQPGATLERWAPVARLFTGLPFIVVGLPLAVVLDLLYPIAVSVAAVRRGWPDTYADLLVRSEEWAAHVFLYMFLATDARPALAPLRRRRSATPIAATA